MPSERRRLVALRADEEELFRAHRERLVRLVRHDTGASLALAEDAVSHAFEQLCLSQPERTDAIGGWLRVVARHEARRLLRKLGREPLFEDVCRQERTGEPVSIDEVAASPHTLELAVEPREALRVLAALKERQRKTLALKVAGYSYRDIEALRGVTYTNVNRQSARGGRRRGGCATQRDTDRPTRWRVR